MSTIETGRVHKKLDLDQILVDEIGQFGKHQIINFLLAAFPIIFGALTAGEYVFTTARINTRCLVPQCDSSNPEFAPNWVLNAIPGSSPTSFEACEQYVNSSLQQPPTEGTCPANLFDTTTTVPCNDYVYENQFSVVYDFNLACKEWKRSQIGSIRTFSTLVSLPITGFFSDRWGRRLALAVSAFFSGWLGLARSFTNTYEWFLTFEVLEALFAGGVYSSSFIFVTELVGPKYRVTAGLLVASLYTTGQIILGLLAWKLPDWRALTRALNGPQLLLIVYFWIFSESVRWLLSRGHYEEAERILKKVAKRNNKVLSETSLKALKETAETQRNTKKPKETWLPLQVIRSRPILIRCLITPFWWLTNSLVFHGLAVNSVNLSGNKYFNYIAVAAVDIPGHLTAILFLNRLGRKPVLITSYWICAACMFGYAFLPEGYDNLSMFLYLFGKYCNGILVSSVYVYTAELYPTKYRHNLFAYSTMIGKIGSTTAPLTPALALEIWEKLPSVLFGSFALVSGLLMLMIPETLGCNLPDTMEEAEQLGKKKTVNEKQ